MSKKMIYLIFIVSILVACAPMQAEIFTDDFNTPHIYYDPVTGCNVAGTMWDGMIGCGASETVDGLNADINRPGQLYIQSTGAMWGGSGSAWNPLGPFLYKVIKGDFIATVQLTDYAGDPNNIVFHNDGGLMARVSKAEPNDDAGPGEDWETIDYFPIWTCGNFHWGADDNNCIERGHNGKEWDADRYLQLERIGNYIHVRTSVDDVNWTEMATSPVLRDDFDGLPLQVGLRHCTYDTTTGYVAFDDFYLETFVNLKARFPDPPDGATVTPTLLRWVAGDYAAEHDVYLGTSFDDVNNATTSTLEIYKGRVADNNYPVSGLEPGITYYWRIDEVNSPPDYTVFKGDVWCFMPVPLKAWNPKPANGAVCVSTHAILSWGPGARTAVHDVYFGTNFNDVNTASRFSPKGVLKSKGQSGTTYDPVTLALSTTYYWRIDEVNFPTIWKGDVWNFTTGPDTPMVNPHLKCWLMLDGTPCESAAFDSSGYHYHGTLYNGPVWGTGYHDGALEFDGRDDYVELPIGKLIGSLTNSTFMLWMNSRAGGSWVRAFDFNNDPNVYMCLGPRWWFMDDMYFAITTDGPDNQVLVQPTGFDLPEEWHHVAVTINANTQTIILYYDANELASTTGSILTPQDLGNTTNNWLGRSHDAVDSYYLGSMDDFRIYDYELSQAEIEKAMLGNPYLAWSPKPTNGSIVDIRHAKPISWGPGDGAAQHDVYFGTDFNDVNEADTSDITGIYRGRQDPNKYTPPEVLQKGETYYWRIDEVNLPNIWKGRIWNFTIAEYLVVEDFESYNPNLADVWKPGGNATVSLSMVPVHEGRRAMVIDYNNTPSPYYSETYADTNEINEPNSLDIDSNWLSEDAKALSLWFLGIPDARGSFSYSGTDPLGPYTVTITADGNDIWGNADQFHYAYKKLNDVGSITARVDSVENTDASAKAGVMIRHTSEPNSMNAAVVVTPGSGVSFQRRTEPSGNSASTTVAGVTAPHWVRLTRFWQDDYFIRAEHANDVDGSCAEDWTQIGTDIQASFIQGWDIDVNIGLCVTSRSYGVMCEADFSNVTLSGTITGNWQSQDIGIPYNDPEPMCVILWDKDSNGIVYHPDPCVVNTGTWTEWRIDLNDFRLQGVDLDKVQRMHIGIGDGAPGSGSGTVYIDDIRLYPAQFVPGKLPQIPADIVYDGVINEEDLGAVTDNWLISDYNVTPQNPGTANLVARYEFEGNFDDSIDDYDGEPNNGATTVNDPTRGQVASFDGTNDYVALPIGPLIASLTNSTFMTWVNFSNTGGAWQRIFDFGNNTTVYMFLTPRIDTAGVMRFAITIGGGGDAEQIVNAPSTLASGWHHVAVTIDADNDTIRLYLDGMQVGENTAATLDPNDLGNTTQNWLGRSQYTADAYFTGYLDDFRIYNRALSQGEVAWIYGLTDKFTQPLYLLLTPADPNINLYNDRTIDFRDFAEFGRYWYQQQIWPTW